MGSSRLDEGSLVQNPLSAQSFRDTALEFRYKGLAASIDSSRRIVKHGICQPITIENRTGAAEDPGDEGERPHRQGTPGSGQMGEREIPHRRDSHPTSYGSQ